MKNGVKKNNIKWKLQYLGIYLKVSYNTYNIIKFVYHCIIQDSGKGGGEALKIIPKQKWIIMQQFHEKPSQASKYPTLPQNCHKQSTAFLFPL